MKKRSLALILCIAAVAIAVNTLVYTDILNGSNTILNLAKRLNSIYVTPKTYIDLARRLPKKPNYNNYVKQLDAEISDKSKAFIEAAFKKDSSAIEQILDSSARYIASKDGSSFIRYIGDETHVEGYMATDKKLLKIKQRWHVLESDNTVTCSVEVYIEDLKSPQLWYLHFKKVKNQWKLFMLENDI